MDVVRWIHLEAARVDRYPDALALLDFVDYAEITPEGLNLLTSYSHPMTTLPDTLYVIRVAATP